VLTELYVIKCLNLRIYSRCQISNSVGPFNLGGSQILINSTNRKMTDKFLKFQDYEHLTAFHQCYGSLSRYRMCSRLIPCQKAKVFIEMASLLYVPRSRRSELCNTWHIGMKMLMPSLDSYLQVQR
jgi:hypothetical protein